MVDDWIVKWLASFLPLSLPLVVFLYRYRGYSKGKKFWSFAVSLYLLVVIGTFLTVILIPRESLAECIRGWFVEHRIRLNFLGAAFSGVLVGVGVWMVGQRWRASNREEKLLTLAELAKNERKRNASHLCPKEGIPKERRICYPQTSVQEEKPANDLLHRYFSNPSVWGQVLRGHLLYLAQGLELEATREAQGSIRPGDMKDEFWKDRFGCLPQYENAVRRLILELEVARSAVERVLEDKTLDVRDELPYEKRKALREALSGVIHFPRTGCNA